MQIDGKLTTSGISADVNYEKDAGRLYRMGRLAVLMGFFLQRLQYFCIPLKVFFLIGMLTCQKSG